MRIVTSKGLEYAVDWIDTPLSDATALYLQMADARLVSEIAPEFEGLTRIERYDEQQGDKVYEGFRVLRQIGRSARGGVLIIMGVE